MKPVINPITIWTDEINRMRNFYNQKCIDSVSLTVFDHNKNAKGLYTKLGFEITETIEEPKKKYIMKKFRNE